MNSLKYLYSTLLKLGLRPHSITAILVHIHRRFILDSPGGTEPPTRSPGLKMAPVFSSKTRSLAEPRPLIWTAARLRESRAWVHFCSGNTTSVIVPSGPTKTATKLTELDCSTVGCSCTGSAAMACWIGARELGLLVRLVFLVAMVAPRALLSRQALLSRKGQR